MKNFKDNLTGIYLLVFCTFAFFSSVICMYKLLDELPFLSEKLALALSFGINIYSVLHIVIRLSYK